MNLSEIIIETSLIGTPFSPEGRMERFTFILDRVLKSTPGNLCEIGAGAGLTTKILLEAAKKHDRKVLVIDPFEDGWGQMPEDYGKPYPFAVFEDNTAGFGDHLIVCRFTSLSSYSIDYINTSLPLAFVFLDGLQYKGNVLNELRLMAAKGAKIICVDDLNRLTNVSEVPLAIVDFLKENNDYLIIRSNLIEGYLIKK